MAKKNFTVRVESNVIKTHRQRSKQERRGISDQFEYLVDFYEEHIKKSTEGSR